MNTFITILNSLPYIAWGSITTIAIVVLALAIGFVMGIPMAVGLIYGRTWVRRTIGVYVWFFRGVPILVLLFLFYFGLFIAIGLNIEAFGASCIVLGLTSAAYQSQIYRGAILSLPQGQLKAARALGMSDATAIMHIILPQAMRLSIPGFANEYSILLKDSTICFVLGAQEIMSRTHFVASRTHEHLAFFITAGIIYFFITMAGVKLLHLLEEKLYIPGYSSQE